MKYLSTKKIFLIFTVIGVILYGMSLFNGFVWDDEEQIVNNASVHSITHIPSFFLGSTFNTGGSSGAMQGMYYKPFMSIFFSILYTFIGSNAFFYHLFQLALHITNVCLLYLIFKRIFVQNQVSEYLSKVIAISVSLLFLVHPVNVEAVVYSSALQDALYMFFGVLALYFLTKTPLNNKNLGYSFILLFCAVLSKETGILFVFISGIYIFLYNKAKLNIFYLYTYLFITLYCILRFAVAGVFLQHQGISPIMRLSIWERFITIPSTLLYYLKTTIFPLDLAIAQHWVVKQADLNNFYLPVLFLLTFTGCCVAIGYYIYRFHTHFFKLYVFFTLWFVMGLGFHSNIFPLDMTVAERWYYLTFVGLLGMISILVLIWSKSLFKHTKSAWLIFGCICLMLGTRTIIRTLDWKNGLTLFKHDVAVSKNAFDLENNLGVELMRVDDMKQAKLHFIASTQIAPYWWTNWNNLGVVYEREGDLEKAEQLYKKSFSNGDYYLAYENYGKILIKQAKYKQAKTFLIENALLKYPNNQQLLSMYGYILEQEKIEEK